MNLPWLAFCSADGIQSILIDLGLVLGPILLSPNSQACLAPSAGFAQRYEHQYLGSCLFGESTKSRKGHMSNSKGHCDNDHNTNAQEADVD